MKHVGIIGMGRAGTVLAYMLAQHDYHVQIVLRRPQSTAVTIKDQEFAVKTLAQVVEEAEILMIATPDKVIGDIVQALSVMDLTRLRAVFHLSGAVSTDILDPLRTQKVAVGSLHPLQSMADLEQSLIHLPGSTLTYDGDPAMLAWIEDLTARLNCRLVVAPPEMNKALYHAGASMASNFLVTLAAMGSECLRQAGFSEEEARKALTALMRGTLGNLENLPPERALTGPIVRGDAETVRMHLDVLNTYIPNLLPAYGALGALTGAMARQTGSLPAPQHELLQGFFK
ncbi:MAG TPA: hypothetical protein DIT32_05605 [Peptococcaceae bacterium]|nr:hypothetical protein [Peptococcaceae bacterium]